LVKKVILRVKAQKGKRKGEVFKLKISILWKVLILVGIAA
jgi:hypothetical protein